MILGVDASNIRGGGGITYLTGLLREFEPATSDFTKVVVWSGRDTLKRIEDRQWLLKRHAALLDKGLLQRTYWQRYSLSREARTAGCDLLFVPGGAFAGDFRPVVATSRNMLPFQMRELWRYGLSARTLKNVSLRVVQSRSFRNADGLIFLTRHAERHVMNAIGETGGLKRIIPHGVHGRFMRPPREQTDLHRYSFDKPLRILYISSVELYKHQWIAAEAVSRLRADGVPISLELIGPAYPRALKRLNGVVERIDPEGEFVRYVGSVPHHELHVKLGEADIFLFASTCENMPNILLEAMASGLPIACSNHEPMPEVLGEGGVYFDPEDADDIARALRALIASPRLRAEKADVAFKRAQSYTSKRCASETFTFLSAVAHAHTNHS